MDYKVSLGKWDFVFAVPCDIVDKYLNFADLTQIKVLLWILKNKDIKSEKICDELKITKEEFLSAFEFWVRLGVFSEGKSSDKVSEKSSLATKPHIIRKKPSSSHVAQRIRESSEIGFLMREAELILGRPISSVDSAVLIALHDTQGLPIDVIIMLLQYSVSIGKGNMRYIENMGINWALSGIDSIERAEEKINSLDRIQCLWKRFESLIGIEHRSPTKNEQEITLRWYEDWRISDELIKYAYEKCVDKLGKYNIKYMDGILKRWHAKGILTLEQVNKESSLYKSKQNSKKTLKSYDVKDLVYDIFDDD